MKVIYCDGACKGNPGLSGSGVVVFDNDKPISKWIGGFQKQGTNNIAELKAMQMALYLAKKMNINIIRTDSQYVINTITKWASSWEAKGWKKKGGIKNLELVKAIYEEYKTFKDIQIEYVKGHSGDKGNDLADQLANEAILKQATKWTKGE